VEVILLGAWVCVGYCTSDDLYAYGLPRGGLPNPAREIYEVLPGSDQIVLDGHGFGTDVPVSFRADAGGSLPSPLSENVTYYATGVTDSVFVVSATVGGATIDITTAGSRILVIQPLPVDGAIAWASAVVDDLVSSHPTPFAAPYPPIVVMTTAELAVGKLMSLTGRGSEKLTEAVDAAQKRLEKWGHGNPIRGSGTSDLTHTNLGARATAACVDRRGWHRSDGNLP
jgi:hypothetical protein